MQATEEEKEKREVRALSIQLYLELDGEHVRVALTEVVLALLHAEDGALSSGGGGGLRGTQYGAMEAQRTLQRRESFAVNGWCTGVRLEMHSPRAGPTCGTRCRCPTHVAADPMEFDLQLQLHCTNSYTNKPNSYTAHSSRAAPAA